MATAPQSTWPLDVLGIYFTIISIFVVYQLLDLQVWLSRVDQYINEFDQKGTLAGQANRDNRKRLRQAGQKLRKKYPTIFTIIFFIIQIGLFVLGLIIDLSWLTDVPWIYTTVPWIGIMVLIILGPFALTMQAKNRIDEVFDKLDDWDKS